MFHRLSVRSDTVHKIFLEKILVALTSEQLQAHWHLIRLLIDATQPPVQDMSQR
jgi:hypothetical protein